MIAFDVFHDLIVCEISVAHRTSLLVSSIKFKHFCGKVIYFSFTHASFSPNISISGSSSNLIPKLLHFNLNLVYSSLIVLPLAKLLPESSLEIRPSATNCAVLLNFDRTFIIIAVIIVR